MSDTEAPITGTQTYNDDDLVYVDPDAKAVVARVEFNEKGHAKPLAMPPRFADVPSEDAAENKPADSKPEAAAPAAGAKPAPVMKGRDRRPPRKPRTRYYPWGTYRTMKKIYKIEGKVFDAERTLTLDDVMEKALQEPYWD